MDKDLVLEKLHHLPHWTLADHGKSIHRKVVCKNFSDAVELINRIRDVAEFENHHPNLHLTGYKHLKIDLSTHSAGHLTDKDFNMAGKIEGLLEN